MHIHNPMLKITKTLNVTRGIPIELAKYIYDYSLGMQVEQVIEIKKLDSDYWDSLKDDT